MKRMNAKLLFFFFFVSVEAFAGTSKGRVKMIWTDGGSFFFQVENASYCGGQNRFSVLPSDPKLSLILLAKSTSKIVTIMSNSGCINDGDTDVVTVGLE